MTVYITLQHETVTTPDGEKIVKTFVDEVFFDEKLARLHVERQSDWLTSSQHMTVVKS